MIGELRKEGDALSVKQGELEKTIKKLKQMYKKKEDELNAVKDEVLFYALSADLFWMLTPSSPVLSTFFPSLVVV